MARGPQPVALSQALERSHSLESLEGSEHLLPPVADTRPAWLRLRQTAVAAYPGLLAAGVIGIAATWLSAHYGAPVMLFALLLGMAFNFLGEDGRAKPGIAFSSRTVLRLGVALLGVRISFEQIASLGLVPVALVLGGVVTTIAIGTLIARRLGLDRSFGVLSGGAVAICGASAALAIASILPRRALPERDIILVVVGVTALSTLAMVIYPPLTTALGFGPEVAGVFLGGTIHDVAQVVGAGYSLSPQTGDVATYVKLLRVAMLLPVVVVLAMLLAEPGAAGKRRLPMPPAFLVGFAALVVVNSLGWLPAALVASISDVSRWLLVTAIAALGMKTALKDLIAVGWRPIGLILAETLWIAALFLAGLLLFMPT